jgi:hypothetical protein
MPAHWYRTSRSNVRACRQRLAVEPRNRSADVVLIPEESGYPLIVQLVEGVFRNNLTTPDASAARIRLAAPVAIRPHFDDSVQPVVGACNEMTVSRTKRYALAHPNGMHER